MTNEKIFNLIRSLETEVNMLYNELKRRNVSWERYALEGQRARAVFAYREKHPNVDIFEIKKIVDEFCKRNS